MMETVTGTPWEMLLSQHVFAPLGMTAIGFGAPGTIGQVDQPWDHRDNGGGQFEPVAPGLGADSPQVLGARRHSAHDARGLLTLHGCAHRRCAREYRAS